MLGCRGEMLTIEPPVTAAESGRAGAVPKAESVMASAGVPAPAWVNAGVGGSYQGVAAGVAGGTGGASGTSGAAGEVAAAAGSGGRPRRRGDSAGAADGGGGMAGGQVVSRAGSGGSKPPAATGCVQNLACQLEALPSTGDVHQDCVDRINQFREQCACLPALERWTEGEACADQMAKYDSSSTEAHAGFGDKICDGGSAQNECPGWRSEAQVVDVCLQKMWDEGPPPMSDCSGSCFQMYGHFLNMTNQRMTKVACGFFKTDEGQIWSVQNFSR